MGESLNFYIINNRVMNRNTREFIWGLVSFISGLVIILSKLDNILLATTRIEKYTIAISSLIGVILIFIGMGAISNNLRKEP